MNLCILFVCTILCIFLLWLGSHIENKWWLIAVGLSFGIVMIPVYSLLHEAEHGIFHPNKKMNYFSGLHLSNLFIVSFTFFQQCHLNHHKHNRTDFEMWDLYYKHQNKFLKYVNFYLKMMGAVYLMLPLSAVLFTLYPPIVFSKIFTGHNETGGFVKGTDTRSKLNRIRIESLGAILFQAALIFVLKLNFFSYGIMYLIHGFVWSSQNYVSHAFSPRDIINGAHNHTISKFVKLIYLNFNVHLAHHQNPQIPWIHLPQVIEKNQQQDSFLKAYLRFWKGPQLTNEPAPN